MRWNWTASMLSFRKSIIFPFVQMTLPSPPEIGTSIQSGTSSLRKIISSIHAMHMLVKVAGFISTSQLKNTSCTWFLFTVAINWQTYHKMLWPVGHTIDLYFGYHCVNGHGMYPLSIDNYLLLWMLDDIPPHLSILRCIINAENYYYTEQVQESINVLFVFGLMTMVLMQDLRSGDVF